MLTDHHPSMKEALCLWQTIRNMGYEGKWIFFSATSDHISFVIQHPALREFAIRLGVNPFGSSGEAEKNWVKICRDWLSGGLTVQELNEYNKSSEIRRLLPLIVSQLAINKIPMTPDQLKERSLSTH